MGYQDDLDDTWGDLAPEQPEDSSRWPIYLAIGVAVLVLLCICSVGGFLAYQEFLATPEPTRLLEIPTTTRQGAADSDNEGSDIGDVSTPTIASQASESPGNTPTQEVATLPSATDAPAPTVTVETATEAAPTETAQTGSAVEAYRLPAAPVIDGSLAEWSDVPAWQSAFLVYQTADWDGSDDLQATWRLAWDTNNLYVGVEVIDDIHVQTQSGNQIFRGDSVDMQIDTNREGDYGPSLSPDDFQFTLSPGDFGALPPSAFRSQGTSSGQILDAPGGNHVIITAVPTALGYSLEAAIPWSDLNLAPVEGLVVGIALNANDNDTPGTAVQEVMKSHVATRTLIDPTGWGTLTLR
jgi:hypothetical protein